MEITALYSLSSELDFQTISICTVSNCIFTQEKMFYKDRENKLCNAIKFSLKLSTK